MCFFFVRRVTYFIYQLFCRVLYYFRVYFEYKTGYYSSSSQLYCIRRIVKLWSILVWGLVHKTFLNGCMFSFIFAIFFLLLSMRHFATFSSLGEIFLNFILVSFFVSLKNRFCLNVFRRRSFIGVFASSHRTGCSILW